MSGAVQLRSFVAVAKNCWGRGVTAKEAKANLRGAMSSIAWKGVKTVSFVASDAKLSLEVGIGLDVYQDVSAKVFVKWEEAK